MTGPTGCVCPAPGWCERHKLRKNPHWHKLCQTRPDYFAAWEAGRGPGHDLPAEPEHELIVPAQPGKLRTGPPPGHSDGGPGTELHKLLGWFGIREKAGCPCPGRRALMDAWGPDGCLEHIDTIRAWLLEQAGKRGLPWAKSALARAIAGGLIRAAIALARRKPAETGRLRSETPRKHRQPQ